MQQLFSEMAANVYYSSHSLDHTHRSTQPIRIDRRLIIFPAHFWSIHYKHTWLNLKSERHQQGKQIVESIN